MSQKAKSAKYLIRQLSRLNSTLAVHVIRLKSLGSDI